MNSLFQATRPQKDTHLEKDTHPRKDTHVEWDSHAGKDTHVEWDTHPRKDTHLEWDTHLELDTHVEKDTHAVSRLSGGFVLIATLWTLAAMAVLAAYIDGVASADMERAAAAEAALERELARRGTEETLAYLLATGRMNYRGLMIEPEQSFSDVEGNRGPDRSVGVIAVAGETYAGIGGMRFSVQDENGLAPVNFPSSGKFVAALSYVGVASADIDRLVPRVEDYVDIDDDLSLSGAERFDYDQAALAAGPGTAGGTSAMSRQRDRSPRAARTPGPGTRGLDRSGATPGIPPELALPHPSNWTMTTPLELRRVLGINELIGPDQWRRLLPMLTVRQTSGYNFNTMRPDVLAAVLEIDAETVDNIRAERTQRSVASLNRIAMLTGTHPDIDEMDLRVLPSRFLRVSIWHNAGGLRSVAGMALTPYGDAPWRIDYRYTEPMARAGPTAPRQAPEAGRTRAERTGTQRDPTEPAIDNESSDVGVLQPATPLLQ